jgi:hypothetical protein
MYGWTASTRLMPGFCSVARSGFNCGADRDLRISRLEPQSLAWESNIL